MDEVIKRIIRKHRIDDSDNVRQLLSLLYAYDPSSNKKYLYWMYDKYVSEFGAIQLKYFDYTFWEKIGDSLRMLENYPERFKNNGYSTDIYSYKTSDNLVDAAEKSYQKNNQRTILKKDTDLVSDKNGVVVLYPSTAEASCFYGRGTRWCITESSMYDDYMDKGNLFFILNKSSNGDDYKSAIFINVFNHITAFNAVDDTLIAEFSDIDKIEYDEYNRIIRYPNSVKMDILNYLSTILKDKPKQVIGRIFLSWVRSLGKDYGAQIINVDDQTYNIITNKKKYIGDYFIGDIMSLKEHFRDYDTYDIFNFSDDKTRNIIKHIGDDELLKYFNLDNVFYDMLLDDYKYPFYKEIDNIEDISDRELFSIPMVVDLKEEFLSDPIKFHNDNIFKINPPKMTNYQNMEGFIFYYENNIDLDKLLKEHFRYCVDAKGQPISYFYKDKKYHIININKNNEDV